MYKLYIVLTIILFLFSACELQNQTEPQDNGKIEFQDEAKNEPEKESKIELQKDDKADPWQELISEEGKFSIEFPGVPKPSVEEKEGLDKKIIVNGFETLYHNIRFSVRYSDYPDVAANEAALNDHYDRRRDYYIKITDSKIVSERRIRYNGWLGREFVMTDGKQIDTYQIYKIGHRDFQLDTSVNSSIKEFPKFKKFMNYFFCTFDLTEKKTNFL